MNYKSSILIVIVLFFIACDDSQPKPEMEEEEEMEEQDTTFYKGADLSYVNEMEDCGASYLNAAGAIQDPYQIFSNAGCDLVRVRLWHNPDWTGYSNLQDVKETIRRSREQNMKVLLDFHYSDEWADPQKQYVPAAWASVVDQLQVLGDSIYQYTYGTLEELISEGLTPEMVQVGNETNIEILQPEGQEVGKINWSRNAFLINKGLSAVRDIALARSVDIQSMLHIAQPENAVWWFKEARDNGVVDFDWIGISYYPKWSNVKMDDLSSSIFNLIATYDKPLMVVETAYPFTMENKDAANNILGEDALLSGYPATEEGQYNYLVDLDANIRAGGGRGLIYWEPAWVSTGCSTRWGVGSHWDNATLFDQENRVIKGMEYYND